MERERVGSFEQLKVWQQAHALVLKVFKLTPSLPADHQESVALPMERLAIEVPRGIAEGFRRRGPRNKAHHYNLAQTALESLRYYFILCRDLQLGIDYDDLARDTDEVARMLEGLVRSMTRGDSGDPRRRGRSRRRGRDRDQEVRDEPQHDYADEDDLVDEP